MRSVALILIILLFTSASWRRHPFYVSMTEIEWKPNEKKLEIAVRIFSDDLEKGLAAHCNCRANLGDPGKSEQMDKLIQSYLTEHLQFSENQKQLRYQYLGREKEDESTWSYLEADASGFTGKLHVKNTILLSVQEKQTNLIRFRKPGYDQTIQLQNPESSHQFP